MSKSVLITGARAPVSIDLSRAFLAAGYEPVLADSVVPWAAKASKAKSAPIQQHPAPRHEFDAFADWLKAYVRDENPALIVPTSEEVFYVAAAAQLGEFSARVFASDIDTLKTLHSKVEFPHLLASIDVDAPTTWRIETREDLNALPGHSSDYVFKPEFSRFATATYIKPEPNVVEGLPFGTGPSWAAQTFIPGEEICFWSAARDGKILAHVAYRPLWRYGRSASYAFEHVESAAALKVAQAVAQATNFTGHLSFDIILTSDGIAIPIECNPRAVSGLHLCDAQAELAHRIMGQREGHLDIAHRRHLSLAMVCLGLPSAIASGRLLEFVSDWNSSKDVLGRAGDKGPIAGALLDATRFAFTGLSRQRSATAETTDDIEWNGQSLL